MMKRGSFRFFGASTGEVLREGEGRISSRGKSTGAIPDAEDTFFYNLVHGREGRHSILLKEGELGEPKERGRRRKEEKERPPCNMFVKCSIVVSLLIASRGRKGKDLRSPAGEIKREVSLTLFLSASLGKRMRLYHEASGGRPATRFGARTARIRPSKRGEGKKKKGALLSGGPEPFLRHRGLLVHSYTGREGEESVSYFKEELRSCYLPSCLRHNIIF